MSDLEDLDSNDFFSTFPLPHSPSLLPFPFEGLESQSHEYPNSHIPSDTVGFSGYFADVDGDVFMSESQALGLAAHDLVSLVDDGSNIDFSAWINETPSDFIDPNLLDLPFAGSSLFYEEADSLAVAETRQLENTVQVSAIENLEGQVLETENFAPSASELPLSTRINQPGTEATSKKRKLLGPSREYEVPPRKKGGMSRAMTPAELNSRTKKGNACITCRTRKQKCNGKIPCHFCLKNLEPRLLKQPCTGPTFLDTVEEDSFFPHFYLYQRYLKRYDTKNFLDLLMNAAHLLQEGHILQMTPDLPFRYEGVFVTREVLFALVRSVSKLVTSNDTGSLPSIASVISRAPVAFMKDLKEQELSNFVILPSGDLKRIAFMEKLILCLSSACHFRLIDPKGTSYHLSGENSGVCGYIVHWIFVRSCEIDLFGYLQTSVKRLNKLQSADIYDVIGALVIMIGALSEIFKQLENSDAISSPKSGASYQEAIWIYKDRCQRLLPVLFYYTDTAISKLPSWSRSDNWKELEKRLPCMLTEQKFRDMFGSQVNKEQRLALSSCLLLLPEEPTEQGDTDIFDNCGSIPDSFDDQRCLHNDIFDKELEEFDLLYMDGLLSKTIRGNFYQVRLDLLYTLASIDWELAIERSTFSSSRINNSNDMLFENLTRALTLRLEWTEDCYEIEKVCAHIGILTEPSVHFEYWIKKILLFRGEEATSGSYQVRLRIKLLYLREGLRWLKLKNLTGGEEIYLFDCSIVVRNGIRDEPRLFDIRTTLKYGNDEEFDGLMSLLGPSQCWVRRTCVQLRGIVSWIKEVESVCRSDRDTALSLSKRIQQTLNLTFEGPDSETQSSERNTSDQFSSFFGASPDEVVNILRDIFKGRDKLSFNTTEPKIYNLKSSDETIEEEIVSLMKSVKSLLLDLHIAEEHEMCHSMAYSCPATRYFASKRWELVKSICRHQY